MKGKKKKYKKKTRVQFYRETSELVYRCFGTTGLCEISRPPASNKNVDPIRNQITKPYSDPRATYIFKPSECRIKSRPALSMTLGVIWARQNAYVDVHEKDQESKYHCINQFTDPFRITRKEGEGQCSEDLWNRRPTVNYEQSQCILFAPLSYREHASRYLPTLGVIRICKPKSSKSEDNKYFSDEHIHLFFSFVDQLSRAILHAKYIEFINNISQITDIKDLLCTVVTEMPKFIGGMDCTILACNAEKTLLKTRAEWSFGHTKYYDEDDDPYPYYLNDPNETGYTKWVAVNKETLFFNTLSGLKVKSTLIDPTNRPKHRSSDKEKQKQEEATERYIGMPIFTDDKEELLGVIRVCKSSKETYFTKDDEQMLNQVCQILGRSMEKAKIIESRKDEIKRYFSKHLIELCKNNRKLESLVKHFYDPKDDMEEVTTRALKHLEELVNEHFTSKRLKIFNNFEMFNSEILRQLPYYRDHFIHQYVVYILGAYILEQLKHYKLEEDIFGKAYNRILHSNQNELSDTIDRIWFVIANYHDISYPFAMTSQWYKNLLAQFLPIDKSHNFGFESEIIRNLVFGNRQRHLEKIDKLVTFHKKIGRKDKRIRNNILSELTSENGMDHGVLSALVVLSENIELEERYISASSIMLHNRMVLHPDIENIDFEKHPFAFLLILCDFLHEWGRENTYAPARTPFHDLNKLIVTRDWEEINRKEFSYINKPDFVKENNIYVHASITLGGNNELWHKKLNEARIVLSHLISSGNIVFTLKINSEGFVISNKFYEWDINKTMFYTRE